jgi:hypothetical protein
MHWVAACEVGVPDHKSVNLARLSRMNGLTIPKDRAQSCGQVQGQAAKATPGKGWRGVLKKQAT